MKRDTFKEIKTKSNLHNQVKKNERETERIYKRMCGHINN